MILLNIGEDTADGRKVLPDKVISALSLADALPVDMAGHLSDSEYTHVVKIPRALSKQELRDLAIVLDQEAIAQWDSSDNHGMLAGPYASKWGSFDASRFLLLSGGRLSDFLYRTAA